VAFLSGKNRASGTLRVSPDALRLVHPNGPIWELVLTNREGWGFIFWGELKYVTRTWTAFGLFRTGGRAVPCYDVGEYRTRGPELSLFTSVMLDRKGCALSC